MIEYTYTYPINLQITSASFIPKSSLHTVPQVSNTFISTRPSAGLLPFTRRTPCTSKGLPMQQTNL
ncbi:hypothetical protein DPMN_177690 [Dreissena polymorpha]|uniref:Uncharacterized protein n=1 Tax=Dreissena polymorpha TaxID=45954 RepID=A0A9D4IJ80_DREPO|nr:hypothetical protein DPMN_177690 [Dreissena polymorpha]